MKTNKLHYWPKDGKWIVSQTVIGTNNEHVVAECFEESEAKLIVAAPDLLEALKAKAAIDKATT